MEQIGRFDNCFSLGWFCGTASSLSQLGLRSFSGPFDWYFSDFSSVLNQIDKEFTDFMKKENLEVTDNNLLVFKDTKYNFYCNHDIKENFEIEYLNIYNKYRKRADRFLESIKNPTCFFRAVRTETEVKYIIKNVDYIEDILKRYNSENSIVYILLRDMDPLPSNLKWFRLTSKEYIGKVYEMRNMFGQSKELLQFCKTLLSLEKIKSNKKFDFQKYGQMAAINEVDYYIYNDIDGIDKKISAAFNLQSDELFYIWGGGNMVFHYIAI